MMRENCMNCGGTELKLILDLGNQPCVNDFRTKREPQMTYPLRVVECAECKLVQLDCEVPQAELFPASYPYRTGTTQELRDNFRDLAVDILSLGAKSVLEIGSNDGTLLQHLRHLRHLGVDPSDACEDAREKGLRVIQDYFTYSLARELDEKFDVITASNVFAHMPDLPDLMAGVLSRLEPHGVFITESHYWPNLVETNQFDAIYHEHLRYYSLTSLQHLFHKHGMEIFFATPIASHGGSIRVFAARRGQRAISPQVAYMLEEEAKLDLDGFSIRVHETLSNLKYLMENLKSAGKIIMAVGAPSRGATLLTASGIAQNLSAVLEVPGSPKIGKMMPGTSLEVIPEADGLRLEPDYLLLLAWHIAPSLERKLREKGFKGKFITPLPEVKIHG